MQTDPVGLDPHLTTATATRNMLENVYDTLVMISAEGRIVPSLAETWKTSEDGLTWTFNIRRNVKFHNGRAMTPEDVAYSINRIRDPRTKSPRATDFQLVDSISAAASSVVVKLKQPFSPLLAKLAWSTNAVVPREAVERDGDLNAHPVGTGPYRFVGYAPQQRLILVRSGDFWGVDGTGRRLPYIDRIEFVFFPDAVARATALRTGTADWIEYVPSSEVQSLKSDPNIEVVGGLSANFRGLYINTAIPPFNNLKVRQAMAWATNRAKRLLAEAGFANGFDADLYVTSTYDFLRTPAEVVQAQMAKVGIKLRIIAADWSVYLPTVFQKKYTLTILGNSGQSDPDDFLYNSFHTGAGGNYVNYTDPQFDKLVEEARKTAVEAQRRQFYEQAQLRLQETVPMVFLFHSTQYEAVRKTVLGYRHWPNTSYLGLRWTWMTGR
jgi:peptide/nickel transport system substrate-binding protein